ncbi:MAG TPA: hypothetical protein VH575_07545, partial [Gemmataceae bacterium]
QTRHALALLARTVVGLTAASEVKVALLGRRQITEGGGDLSGAKPARRRLSLAQARPNLVQIPARPRFVRAIRPRWPWRCP